MWNYSFWKTKFVQIVSVEEEAQTLSSGNMLELWILDIFYCENMKDTDGKQAMQVFAFDDTI